MLYESTDWPPLPIKKKDLALLQTKVNVLVLSATSYHVALNFNAGQLLVKEPLQSRSLKNIHLTKEKEGVANVNLNTIGEPLGSHIEKGQKAATGSNVNNTVSPLAF